MNLKAPWQSCQLDMDRRSEHKKGKEEKLQPDQGYHQREPGGNSKFHDIIKEEDWDKLK